MLHVALGLWETHPSTVIYHDATKDPLHVQSLGFDANWHA